MKTIKELTEEERPYEKCERFGAGNLTDIELLAILLRTGTKGESSIGLARRILYPEFGEKGVLSLRRWTFERLLRVKGIGKVKAIQILCICELARRISKASAGPGLQFDAPDTIARYYMEDLRYQKQESMKLLLLNTKSRLIGETDISKGTVNSAVISPRELFVEALQKDAVSIILLHNHPSGDPTPSREDILVTKRVFEAGRMIGVELLDHIIIGNNCYSSMREQGIFKQVLGKEGRRMFRNIYGLDLGTYEIKVFDKKRDFIWKEKNIIARKDKEFLCAAGDEAWVMFEKSPDNIEVLFPMQNGVIARFNDMQCLLENLLKKERPFSRGAEYLVAVPADVTEVEKRAFYDLVYHSSARAKSVRIIERGIADAIGFGVNALRTEGILMVDMGGGSTDISVLCRGGMVLNHLLKTGGEHLDQAIRNQVRHHMEFLIGRRTAESLRQDLGIFENVDCREIEVTGRDLKTGIPVRRPIPVSMVRTALKEPLKTCAAEIKAMFDRTPPVIRSAVEKNGICLTGGLSNLKELSTYLQVSTGLTVRTCARPELCVVEGLKAIIRDKKNYRDLTYSLSDEGSRWLR